MITKVLLSAGSHEELYKGVQALREYDDFKYTLLNDAIFVRSCEALESRVEPTSAQDIMAALRLHPSSGAYGMSLFDEIICYSFISDYHGQGEAEKCFH